MLLLEIFTLGKNVWVVFWGGGVEGRLKLKVTLYLKSVWDLRMD